MKSFFEKSHEILLTDDLIFLLMKYNILCYDVDTLKSFLYNLGYILIDIKASNDFNNNYYHYYDNRVIFNIKCGGSAFIIVVKLRKKT